MEIIGGPTVLGLPHCSFKWTLSVSTYRLRCFAEVIAKDELDKWYGRRNSDREDGIVK